MKKQAFNPYLPGYEYIPDGEPYVFGDRVYIYGSHDAFGGETFCVNDYVCWSAPVDDLGNWNYEGIIYRKEQDPMYDGEKAKYLYAPDVQQGTDGRFYLYYVFDLLSIVAVAVCDTPAGEYQFYGYVHYADGTNLGRKEGDSTQFDPGVFLEGEEVYLYTGFAPDLTNWNGPGEKPTFDGPKVYRLETDMLTIKEAGKQIAPIKGTAEGTSFEGHEFLEASSLRKINDKYYFIYSSIYGHELCYAVSDYPDRDFEYKGVIISNGDIHFHGRTMEDAVNYYGNNHGSIVEIQGKWYIFYHRQTNRNQFSRQACAEEIFFDKEGNIAQVECTSCGLNGKPLEGHGTYEARIACNLYGREGAILYGLGDIPVNESHPYFTQDETDGTFAKQYIANMNDGSVAGYKYFHIQNLDRIAVEIRGNATGILYVSTSPEEAAFAELKLHKAEDWEWIEAKAELSAEKTALCFRYEGDGSFDFRAFEL